MNMVLCQVCWVHLDFHDEIGEDRLNSFHLLGLLTKWHLLVRQIILAQETALFDGNTETTVLFSFCHYTIVSMWVWHDLSLRHLE